MKRIVGLVFVLGLCAVALAGSGPLAKASKYDGKFKWIKLPVLPADSQKSLAGAKSILIDVTFPKDVTVAKDGRGNQWFTFIVADQGSDWKWNQTSGSGGVKLSGGKIKAGTYTVTIPVTGIPKSVLKDKMQTISVGPATSGLSAPTAFAIDALRGK